MSSVIDDPAGPQLVTPLPSVISACPFDPFVVGNVSVHASVALLDDCNVVAYAPAAVLARIIEPRVVCCVPNVMSSLNVGLLEKTREPVPVSSLITPASCAEGGLAKGIYAKNNFESGVKWVIFCQ